MLKKSPNANEALIFENESKKPIHLLAGCGEKKKLRD